MAEKRMEASKPYLYRRTLRKSGIYLLQSAYTTDISPLADWSEKRRTIREQKIMQKRIEVVQVKVVTKGKTSQGSNIYSF